jgi:hypothetical protein
VEDYLDQFEGLAAIIQMTEEGHKGDPGMQLPLAIKQNVKTFPPIFSFMVKDSAGGY